MKRIALLVTPMIVHCHQLSGMDETSMPKIKNKDGKSVVIPTINILAASHPEPTPLKNVQDTHDNLSVKKTMPESPRLHPNENESEMLARGDRTLYTAITSNDLTVLNTFLHEAATSKNFAIWWQDFILNADIVTTPLTANDRGDTYTLIKTLIHYDTNNPIGGSHTARVEAIFPSLHPSAQRSTRWLDTAIAYNNSEARTFISQNTMKRDNSSFFSDGSDDSTSPRPNDDPDDTYESLEASSHDSNEGSDSEHERISEHIEDTMKHGNRSIKKFGQFQMPDQTIFLALIGITSCIIINGFLYFYYQDTQETDEDSTPDTDNDLNQDTALEIIL